MSSNPSNPERFDLNSIFQAILDNFNVNKGIIKTYRLLTTQPGQTIRSYLLGDRSLLTKPFQLLVVSTAIAAFLTIQVMPSQQFAKGFEEGYNHQNEQVETPNEEQLAKLEKAQEVQGKFAEYFSRYFNLVILLMIPFLSLATFWFFKKQGYNFAEHIVFNSYVLSYQNFIFILLAPLIFFVSPHFNLLYLLIAYAYYFYVCQRFFELRFWPNFGKAFGALIVGTLMYVFVFIAVLLGVVFIFFKN